MHAHIFTLIFGLFSFMVAYLQAGVDVIPTATSAISPTFRLHEIDSFGQPDSHSPIQVGSITGRVYYGNAQGAYGVNGVKLVLRSSTRAQVFVREQVSGAAGDFSFEHLPPGEYSLSLDPTSLPQKFRINFAGTLPLKVEPESETKCDIPVAPRRVITGMVYLDKNGDNKYTADKDEALHGALVSVEGALAVTNEKGSYVLEDLPAGRLAMLVQSSRKGTNAAVHVLLDLGQGPVTNRVIDIPIQP